MRGYITPPPISPPDQVDDAPLGVALHDLGDADVAPGAQPGTPRSSHALRVAKRLADSPYIRAQAVGTDQERAVCGTAAHPLNAPTHQRHVALSTDLTSEPHAGADHPRQGPPHDAALCLHADRVGLHVSQVPWWLDQSLLDGLSLLACACPPIRDRPLVEPEGRDDSLPRAAMRQQRPHNPHQLSRGTQPVEDGACRRGEGFVALLADEPLRFARMETNIPLASLASGGTRPIGAACCLWGP